MNTQTIYTQAHPEATNDAPTYDRIAHGRWAAFGHGWAVHGDTQEEVTRLFWEAVERHAWIAAHPGETWPGPAAENGGAT